MYVGYLQRKFTFIYNQSWAVFKYIVFKYIYCIYTLYLNTFFNLYLITVFKYFWSVYKYMYLNTFLNTLIYTSLNINNRSSVDWSANHGFKHFNALTCCICLLLNNTVLYPLLCYIFICYILIGLNYIWIGKDVELQNPYLFVKTMENCLKANEKRCTMPYSLSLYNVGVVTLFISAIINVTNLLHSLIV